MTMAWKHQVLHLFRTTGPMSERDVASALAIPERKASDCIRSLLDAGEIEVEYQGAVRIYGIRKTMPETTGVRSVFEQLKQGTK